MWRLLETRWGIGILWTLAVALAGGGIWMDAQTDLDPRAVLLGATAAGTVLVAACAGRQAYLTRWRTEVVLTPHLVAEDCYFRPNGFYLRVRNHGAASHRRSSRKLASCAAR